MAKTCGKCGAEFSSEGGRRDGLFCCPECLEDAEPIEDSRWKVCRACGAADGNHDLLCPVKG